jgi:hypothetical protein
MVVLYNYFIIIINYNYYLLYIYIYNYSAPTIIQIIGILHVLSVTDSMLNHYLRTDKTLMQVNMKMKIKKKRIKCIFLYMLQILLNILRVCGTHEISLMIKIRLNVT